MSKFLFVANDIIFHDKTFYVEDILKKILDENIWLFSDFKVPHLTKIKPGDEVVLYIAGIGRRYYHCKFTIAGNIKKIVSDETKLYRSFNQYVDIKDLKVFKNKVYINEMLEDLSFIIDKKNYGLYLRRAIRLLSEEDYYKILSKIENLN